MRAADGNAAEPAARCKNRRRANPVAFTLSGRRCVRRFFDTIGRVPGSLLRLSLMLTTPSFVPLAAVEKTTPIFSARERAVTAGIGPSPSPRPPAAATGYADAAA